MVESVSWFENLRSMRIVLACALLTTCWRIDALTLASNPTSLDRYQQRDHLAGQGVVGMANRSEMEQGRPAPMHADHGTIDGVVVNGSRNQIAVSGAEVVLRAKLQGQFEVAQVTTTDSSGRFRFENLPLIAGIQYVPGANHEEIHYPGPRLRFTDEKQNAQVKLVIYEPSNGSNPLVLEQHDITVRLRSGVRGPGVLEVTESMVVHNPSNKSFIGESAPGSEPRGTLQLAIPSHFERVTFAKEFYGRRFSLVDRKLWTDIPWPPGTRRLEFTYVLPHDQSPVVWQRTLDLPCSLLRLTVLTDKPDEVLCNLKAERSTADHQVTYTTSAMTLSAGQQIHLQMGPSPYPMIVYGRWLAVTLLGALLCGISVCLYRGAR
jgi:hypothetical protein